MVNAGSKIREVGGDANLLSINFYMLLALSSQLSVLSKLCIMNTLLHFSVMSIMTVVTGTYPWVARISPS